MERRTRAFLGEVLLIFLAVLGIVAIGIGLLGSTREALALVFGLLVVLLVLAAYLGRHRRREG